MHGSWKNANFERSNKSRIIKPNILDFAVCFLFRLSLPVFLQAYLHDFVTVDCFVHSVYYLSITQIQQRRFPPPPSPLSPNVRMKSAAVSNSSIS